MRGEHTGAFGIRALFGLFGPMLGAFGHLFSLLYTMFGRACG